MIKYKTIHELVQKMEQEDIMGNTHISKYVDYSQRENIEKIEAYVNSKHISGDKDSQGRDKPFFNIVTAAVNVWYRATDIDRKNIKIKATRLSQAVLSFLATLLLQQWMRKTKFGMFLNEWGRSLAKYGSSVVKFVEKDGVLYSEVVPWSRLICDPVDFENNPKVEILWLTPAQLRANKGYDKELVEKLIKDVMTRETVDGQQKDNKSDYIKLYEIHGNLSKYYLTEDEDDEDKYEQQMHVVSMVEKKDSTDYNAHCLISGKEKKDPYMITHLIKEDDRTMAIGAVENLFEAQWMVNHNKKAIKDQLDLASKLIFQTSDGNFVGQNVLSSIENGQILIHETNMPLTQVANNSHDIGALQAYGQEWIGVANQINNISESMMGINPPSGTAWRQTEALLQESHSLFELMVENKGLYLEDMLREFVIPHLKKKIDTTEEISEILNEYQIKKLDSMFVPNKAVESVNKAIKDDILNKKPQDILSGNLFTPEMQSEQMANAQTAIQDSLAKMGNQRFIKPSDIEGKTWKEVLKDLEWELEVDVTGEQKDNQAVMQTLSTVFQTVASFQGQPLPPKLNFLLNKILEHTAAISPLELQDVDNQPMPAPIAPLGAPSPMPIA